MVAAVFRRKTDRDRKVKQITNVVKNQGSTTEVQTNKIKQFYQCKETPERDSANSSQEPTVYYQTSQ